MTYFRVAFVAVAMTGVAGSANAALRICNETTFVQSVTVGYEGPEGWTSKGWWNIDPSDCSVVVGGELQQRYYYYRAEVNGGDFPGEGYMFCTTPQEFEIVGDTNCEARGYDNESFREIDTGASAVDFTFTLVSNDGDAPPPRNDDGPGNDTADLGLTICNQTNEVQSVSIGFEGDEGFMSQGWWNIDPDDCALVIAGELERRYYYYRSEVNAGPFEGEGYMFCTLPKVYEIIGDSNCESRGYDTESFSEIDTGPTALGYTLNISADGSAAPPPPPEDDGPETVNGNGGIEVCNETDALQSVAFGYEGPEDWTSEGWWNVDPDECVVPALDGVNRRYLYYTAVGDGLNFQGDGYFFCSSPEAFVIVGDSNCEARGYERSDFTEVDTGGTSGMYTLVLANPGTTKSPDNTGGKDDGDGKPPSTDTGLVDDGDTRIKDEDTPETPSFDFGLPDDGDSDGDTTTVVDSSDTTPDTPEPDTSVNEPDTTVNEPDTTITVEEPEPDPAPVDTDLPEVVDPPAQDDGPRQPPRRGGSRGG